MIQFAQLCEQVGATQSKLRKTALVAAYFRSRTEEEEAAISAVFLSGRPFPAWEEATLQVGGTLLWRTLSDFSGCSEAEIAAAYRRLGDLGAVAGSVLPARQPGLTLLEVQNQFRRLSAARGALAKQALLRELLPRAAPLEAKYLVKIITGDLRIGLKESLVEEAIARAYDAPLADVQRSNLLLGDLGQTLRLAAEGRLREACMRLFHPLGFMLATPVVSSEEALSYFANPLFENKYDGIRAQAHVLRGEVKLFSRTRDEITESFPELPAALGRLPGGAILDGEIVAWSYSEDGGRALPFSALQRRLGRKKVSAEMMRRVPVAYVVFDVLYCDGQLLLDHPLAERSAALDRLLSRAEVGHAAPATRVSDSHGQGRLLFHPEDAVCAQVIRAPVSHAATADEVDHLFEAAQTRGNEGLMIKDPQSPYAPGRRGKCWLKLKRELATLDVVVTAVEHGHGKRIGVLSDYTFAVWDGDRLVNIGKAYSGLTDPEIAEMTQWFLEHTTADHGLRREVEPSVVLEVAFNNMMRSARHESGYALRFPRILRIRKDKAAAEADTLERAAEIFEKQSQPK
jgi:DNA ligase-1